MGEPTRMPVTNKRSVRGSADWRAGRAAGSQPDQGLVRYLNRILAVSFLFAMVVIGAVWIWPEAQYQKVLDREIAELEKAKREAEDRRDAARSQLGWVRYDPAYRELIARDKLDLYRPGEVVFHIDRSAP